MLIINNLIYVWSAALKAADAFQPNTLAEWRIYYARKKITLYIWNVKFYKNASLNVPKFAKDDFFCTAMTTFIAELEARNVKNVTTSKYLLSYQICVSVTSTLPLWSKGEGDPCVEYFLFFVIINAYIIWQNSYS